MRFEKDIKQIIVVLAVPFLSINDNEALLKRHFLEWESAPLMCP